MKLFSMLPLLKGQSAVPGPLVSTCFFLEAHLHVGDQVSVGPDFGTLGRRWRRRRRRILVGAAVELVAAAQRLGLQQRRLLHRSPT